MCHFSCLISTVTCCQSGLSSSSRMLTVSLPQQSTQSHPMWSQCGFLGSVFFFGCFTQVESWEHSIRRLRPLRRATQPCDLNGSQPRPTFECQYVRPSPFCHIPHLLTDTIDYIAVC